MYNDIAGTKDSKDVRRVADLLEDLIDAGYDARRGLKARWELVEQVYRNDPSVAGIQLFDNFEPRALPVMSPRINRIVSTTMAAIEGPGVWFQAVPDTGDSEGADALERGVQTTLERARFIRTIRRALVTACLCGVTVVRVRLGDDGIVLEHIHPNDFVVSPAYGLDIREAHLVGHRFYVPRWKIKERKKQGIYPLVKDGEPSATDPDNDPSGRDPGYDLSNAESLSSEKDAELVELWECIVRLTVKGKAGMYRVVFNKQDREVYQIEKYPYDRPWYFDMRLHDEEGKFWPSTSPAINIVGICLMKAEMMNLMAVGSMATCANPTIISGGSLGKKIQSLSLGQLIEVPNPEVKVQQIPLSFDPKVMPLVIEYIDRAIEAQTGVSDNRLNAETQRGERVTAREIAAIEAAAQQNEGSYFQFFKMFVEDVADFVQQIFAKHPKRVKAAYKGAVTDEAILAAQGAYRWRVTGNSGSSAPEIVLGYLQALLGLTQNPLSNYDYQKVEKAIAQAMPLQINLQKLEKTPEQMAQAEAAVSQMAQATMAEAGGSDPLIDGGLAPSA